MVNLNETNYGLLYSAEPEYLRHLNEDAIAQGDKSDGVKSPAPSAWEAFSALKAKLS